MKYRISVGWQLFSYFFGGVMVVMGIFMAQKVVATGAHNQLFFVGFAVLMTLFAIMFIVNTARTLVEIDDEKVTVTTLFGARSMAFSDIRGYGTGEKNMFYLIPKGSDKNLNIPPNLAGRDQLLSFFTLKYGDVNALQLEEATTHLLEDERFGTTTEERASRLKSTTRIAMILNYAPMVLLLLVSINNQYYEWIMWVILAVPWVVAILTRRMKGMISLLPKRNNPAPSFFLALIFSGVAAFVGVVPKFNFYDLGGKAVVIFLIAGTAAMMIYLAICGDGFAPEEKKPLVYLGLGLLFCIYGSSLVIFTNCFYDRSIPRHFQTELEDKHISHGKSDTYYLTLSAWGTYGNGKNYSVSREFYNEVEKGDPVQVNLFGGRCGLPWYRLDRPGTLITPVPDQTP